MDTDSDTSKSWNASIIIAVLALLISSASAFISLKESRIMLAQQNMLSEQQEALMWLYLEDFPYHYYSSDSTANFQFKVQNRTII